MIHKLRNTTEQMPSTRTSTFFRSIRSRKSRQDTTDTRIPLALL